MPKISKIRITNAQLDTGNKTFGNKVWDLRVNNTLFLLENGGGKTSVIHMIHQAITPNVMIQKRKIHETLKKGATTHIALEWQPDDEERAHFITGFTLYNHGKKSEKDQRDYDYISYVYEIEKDNFTLDDLPFVQEGRVTTLFDLDKILKQSPGVMTFQNEVKRYTDALQSYGIFQNEWSNIGKINGGEGGIQEFFDKAKTIPSLISKLFVPSLEDNLYGKDQRNSIIEVFRRHKDSLLRIPQMEKTLVDFQIIKSQSESIIQASEAFGQIRNAYKINRDKLGSFHKTIFNEVGRMKEKMSILESNMEELKHQENELGYAIDSFDIHKEREKKEMIDKEKSKYKEQVEELETDIRFYEAKINEEFALEQYNRYERKNKQITREESQLELMNMNNNDRNKKFQASYEKVSYGNSYLAQQEKINQNNKKEYLIEVKRNMENGKDALEEKINELQQVSIEKSKLDATIESYEKEREGIISTVKSDWKGSTEDTIISLENRQSTNTAQLQLAEDSEKKLDQEKIELNETLFKTQMNNEAIQNEESKMNSQLNDYYEICNALTDNLSVIMSMDIRGKLFNLKHPIEQKMYTKMQKNEEKIVNLNIQRKSLETDLEIVENDGFYVHPELKEVKEELYMKGLDLVLGTEYLLHLNIPKEEKEQIVKTNPLISFSIIIEESEVFKLKQTVARMKHNLSIPVFFLKRESLMNNEEKDHFFALNDDNYVLQRFESLLTQKDWGKFKQVKKQELENIMIQIDELEKEKIRYGRMNERLKQFYDLYDDETEQELLVKLKAYKKQFEESLILIEFSHEQSSNKDREAKRLTQLKEGLNKKIKQDERTIIHLKGYLERYKNIDSQKANSQQIQIKLDTVQREKKQQDTNLDNLHTEREKLVLQIERINQTINELDQHRIDFQLDKIENPEAIERNKYDRDLETLKQRKTEISTEESKKQEVRERIVMYEKELDEMTADIKKLGYDIVFFKNKNRAFDQRMLEEYELKKENFAADLNVINEKVNLLNSDFNSSNTLIKNYLEKVKEKYGVEKEFLYGEDANNEYNNYRLELERATEKMNQLETENERLTSAFFRYDSVLGNIDSIADQFTNKDDVEELCLDEWNQEKPIETFRKLESKDEVLIKQLAASENKIQTEINGLMQNIKETKNSQLISMSQKLKRFLEQNKLNYESLIDNFYTIMETTDRYRDSVELMKEDAKRSEDEVIDIMRIRSETLYSSIKEIEKNSIVDLSTDRKATVKIRWEKESDVDSTANFKNYITNIINEIIDMENKEIPGKEIEAYISKELRMENVLNCYARLDNCDLRVWKPRNDILSNQVTYDRWDKASNWSGGETSSFKVTMFISFNNLLRKKKTSKENTSKVLIMDNPFGEASSKHVIRPMVDLAKKTNTQLFCLTDINNDDVLNSFDTLISNKYISHLGRAALHSEITYKETQLDSLVYSKEI